MSFYNMIFGKNPMSDVILATLGLTRSDVGRFRDVYLEEDTIAVYTRNGGGNRECWCGDNPKYGMEKCKGHVIVEQGKETIRATKEEIEAHPEWEVLNVHYSDGTKMVQTGKEVEIKYNYCEYPDSIDCACPGCIISYRLPKHLNYISSEDDDFDCTYATIRFSFPEEYADVLKKISSGEKFDPDKRWLDFLDSIKKM